MGSNPINLALRFILEIATLIALGYWGWDHGDGILKYILAVGIPLITAILWGTFAVPDDPSRSGKAPVPVPGLIRLLLELAFFAFGVLALIDSGYPLLGTIMGILVISHYVISYDRVWWLLRQ
jgi:hypothetical protein